MGKKRWVIKGFNGLFEETEKIEREVAGWLKEWRGVRCENPNVRSLGYNVNKYACCTYSGIWPPFPTCTYTDPKELNTWCAMASVLVMDDYFRCVPLTFLIDSSRRQSIIGNHILKKGIFFTGDPWYSDTRFQQLRVSSRKESTCGNFMEDLFVKFLVQDRVECKEEFQKILKFSKITRRQNRKCFMYSQKPDIIFDVMSHPFFDRLGLYERYRGLALNNVFFDGVLGADSFPNLRPSTIIMRFSGTHAVRDSRLGVLHIMN